MSDDLKFDWDKSKAVLNKKKHGVSFEEAITVFYDDDALEFHDPDHSEREDRFFICLRHNTTAFSPMKCEAFLGFDP